MATRRSVGKRPTSADRIRQSKDEDLALAEELLHAARKDRATVATEAKMLRKSLRQLGLRAKPIGAKKLRELARRERLDPEGTEFSRGIIEMREE